MKTLRILISSPDDVAEERDRARQVVEGLRRRYAQNFYLKPVLWEELPLQADMSFQQGIDLVLSHEQGLDLAIFVLWSRLGSPQNSALRRPNGAAYRSGTEREFDLMLQARAQSGGVRPSILVYTRADDASFDERLRGISIPAKEDLIHQKKLVESFIREEFQDATTKLNVRAYHSFDRPVTFSQRLRAHLTELLDELAGGDISQTVWDIERQGPPFLGLQPFQPEHANVFFGREDEILEVRHALREQARNGCAFVLLSGASGSGKSSLARAGVLTAISENEIDEQVTAWRTIIFTPSELAPDPLSALVHLIAADGVLPELRGEDGSVDDFAEALRKDSDLAFKLRLKPAFTRAAKRAGGGVRLLMVLDQLEELFASATISAADRASFLSVLEALARCGSVWVIATARSDFNPQLQTEPALVRLKAGLGTVDVLPPTPDAFRRIIEEPARLAGLQFEQGDGHTLSDQILREAATRPELLPLVEDVLRELFERGKDERRLTFAAYEELGGVEGALAKRADNVFDALPGNAQASLGTVFNALVTIGAESEKIIGSAATDEVRLVRQSAPLTSFPENTGARILVDAFVRHRLFTTGEHPRTGEASVTVSHESLLRVWPRAVAWAADNRDFLRVRARIAVRRQDGSELSEGEPLLSEAKAYLRREDGFTAEERSFINDNVARIEAGRQRRAKVRRRVMLGLSILTLLSLTGGGLAFWQARRANAEARRANAETVEKEKQFARAETERKTALTRLSDGYALQARDAQARGLPAQSLAQIGTALLAHPNPPAALLREFSHSLLTAQYVHEVATWRPAVASADAFRNALFDRSGDYLVVLTQAGLDANKLQKSKGALSAILDVQSFSALPAELPGATSRCVWDVGDRSLLVEIEGNELLSLELPSVKVLGRAKIDAVPPLEIRYAPNAKGCFIHEISSGRLIAINFDEATKWQTLNPSKKDPVEEFAAPPEGEYLLVRRKSGAIDIHNQASGAKPIAQLPPDSSRKSVYVGPRGDIAVTIAAEEEGIKVQVLALTDVAKPLLETKLKVPWENVQTVRMTSAGPKLIFAQEHGPSGNSQVIAYDVLRERQVPVDLKPTQDRDSGYLVLDAGHHWMSSADLTMTSLGDPPKVAVNLISGEAISFHYSEKISSTRVADVSSKGVAALADSTGISAYKADLPRWTPRLLTLDDTNGLELLWRFGGANYYAVNNDGVAVLDESTSPPELRRIYRTGTKGAIEGTGNASFHAAGGETGTLLIWRAGDGKLLHRFQGPGKCTALAISHGKSLVAAAFATAGETLPKLLQELLTAVGLTVEDVEQQIERQTAAGKTPGDIQSWFVAEIFRKAQSGEVEQDVLLRHSAQLMSGGMEFATSKSSEVWVIDAESGTVLSKLPLEGTFDDIVASPVSGQFFCKAFAGSVSRLVIDEKAGQSPTVDLQQGWLNEPIGVLAVQGGDAPTFVGLNGVGGGVVVRSLVSDQSWRFPVARRSRTSRVVFTPSADSVGISTVAGLGIYKLLDGQPLPTIVSDTELQAFDFANDDAVGTLDLAGFLTVWEGSSGRRLGSALLADERILRANRDLGSLAEGGGWWVSAGDAYLRCWTSPSQKSRSSQFTDEDRSWIARELTVLTRFDAEKNNGIPASDRNKLLEEVRTRRANLPAQVSPVEAMLMWKLSSLLGEPNRSIHPFDEFREADWFAELNRINAFQRDWILPLVAAYWPDTEEGGMVCRQQMLQILWNQAAKAKNSPVAAHFGRLLWEASANVADPEWQVRIAVWRLNNEAGLQGEAGQSALLTQLLPRLLSMPKGRVLAARMLLERLNKPDATTALRLCEEELKDDALNLDALWLKGAAYAKLNRPREALSTWENLLASPKATVADFKEAGNVAAKLGDLTLTQSIFSEAAKRFPKDESVQRTAGWAFINLNEHAAALRSFEASRSLLQEGEQPGTDLLAGLAAAQWLNRQESAAIETYKKLIESDEKTNWADPKAISAQGWTEAETKPLEALRAATIAKHPDLAANADEAE